MIKLKIWLDQRLIGHLSHDVATNSFAFDYTPDWLADPGAFAIGPTLALRRAGDESAEVHSAQVRQFFENLLPEGEALDHAAQSNGLSKANLVGLMIALGKETAGALRVEPETSDGPAQHDGQRASRGGDAGPQGGLQDEELRRVTREELSERIRARAEQPFSIWDGKVRLSIAGYQDKIAVYERGGDWFLAQGPLLASTFIVKPMPVRPQLRSLPAIEFMCMQLARLAGLDVAETRLEHVPEPVLFVRRFDRVEEGGRVKRLHLIDGCQALGLSVAAKYERNYGDAPEVRNIREGASHARLFALVDEHGAAPARDRLGLLDWVIFQRLIGNTDAHGKNVSFFCGVDGLSLAPAYDLICIGAINGGLPDAYAMAIGDAFTEDAITPFEWGSFARDCGLPLRLVSQRLKRLAQRVLKELPAARDDAIRAGVAEDVAASVAQVVERNCARQKDLAPAIAKLKATDFE